jgi:diacylglycerol kinase family enzyme
VLLAAMRTGRRRWVSLRQLDDRWFTFTAGIGFDAANVAAVEKHRRRGERSTHSLYARVTAREYLRSDRRHPTLHVELADGSVIEHVFYAIVANCDPWTFVGNRPLRPTPAASFDAGLDLYVRRRMGLPGVVHSVVAMGRKNPRRGWGAMVEHDLPNLVVVADEPLPVQVDGDLLEPREKLQFRSVPRAISVLA